MNKLKIKELKKYKKTAIAILIALVSLPILLLTVIVLPFNKKVFPNIFVAGVYVGDKTKDQASEILIENTSLPEKLVLTADEQVFEIMANEIDLSYNINGSVDRAYFYSSSGNYLSDIFKKVALVFRPVNLGLVLNYDETKLDKKLSDISAKIGTEPIYPTVSESGGSVVLDKGKNGIRLNIEKTKNDLLRKVSMTTEGSTEVVIEKIDVELSQEEGQLFLDRAQKLFGKRIDLSFEFQYFSVSKDKLFSFLSYSGEFDDKQVADFVHEIALSVNRIPQDSVFMVKGGSVVEFVPSVDGVIVDEDSLDKLIKDALKTLEETDDKSVSLEIPVNKSPAKIKNEDVNNLGINTLLGRGVSYFRGSIQNRVYNIDHASKMFRGILVEPGKTFSFNEILEDVSQLTGYKSAYVIKDGKTVLGDGGGVCQVSTTLFRAILDAGLPISERRAHSYRVGYYEQGFPVGLDATVYYPTTDLKFVNNTSNHLLVQSSIDIPHSTLVFEIYGTDDGRVAKTTKPAITSSTAPDEDLYVDDPSLPAGAIKQIEYRAWGARVVFDYSVTRNGETLTQKTFVSNYRPWQAVFLRGTGPTN